MESFIAFEVSVVRQRLSLKHLVLMPFVSIYDVHYVFNSLENI